MLAVCLLAAGLQAALPAGPTGEAGGAAEGAGTRQSHGRLGPMRVCWLMYYAAARELG